MTRRRCARGRLGRLRRVVKVPWPSAGHGTASASWSLRSTTVTGQVGATLHELAGAVRPFMVWNTVLAFVPFGLGIMLFRPTALGPGRTRTPLWWITFAIWIAFLPERAVRDHGRRPSRRRHAARVRRPGRVRAAHGLRRVLRVRPRALRLVDVALRAHAAALDRSSAVRDRDGGAPRRVCGRHLPRAIRA